jgi:hypothetical protein
MQFAKAALDRKRLAGPTQCMDHRQTLLVMARAMITVQPLLAPSQICAFALSTGSVSWVARRTAEP